MRCIKVVCLLNFMQKKISIEDGVGFYQLKIKKKQLFDMWDNIFQI